MKKKQAIRIVIFFLLVGMLLVCLCRMFKISNDQQMERFEKFRDLEKGELDGVYIGSSGVDHYWYAAKGYEDTGMTIYPLTTDANPPWLVKNMVREALKYQPDVELLIIDVRAFVEDLTRFNRAQPMRVISNLRMFSWNRFDAAYQTMKIYLRGDREGFSVDDVFFYLPFIQFHNKWEDEGFSTDEFFDADPSPYLGLWTSQPFVNSPGKKALKQLEETVYTDARGELNPYVEEALNELLDYLDTLGKKVLFIDNPHAENELQATRTNAVGDIVTARGYDFLKIVTDDLSDYNLNYKEDFYNAGHVNYYGCVKFTDYLEKIIDEMYDLPDHRVDNSAPDFEGVVEKVEEKIAELEEKRDNK